MPNPGIGLDEETQDASQMTLRIPPCQTVHQTRTPIPMSRSVFSFFFFKFLLFGNRSKISFQGDLEKILEKNESNEKSNRKFT